MKSIFKFFLCVSLVLSSTLYSHKSEALVGLATWNSKTSVIAAATSVGGAVGLGTGFVLASIAPALPPIVGKLVYTVGLVAAWGGMLAVPVGIIILEDDSFRFYYQAMGQHEGLAIGLSASERQAFNSHVPVFNAIMDEIWDLPEATDFEALWVAYSDQLEWDRDTRSALSKVSFSIANTVMESSEQ